jgi:multicomponent K+:H+ antiporter subunit E
MRHLLQPLLEHPLAVFSLTLLWLLLQGHLAPGQILLGIALAVVVTKISSHFWTNSQPARRPLLLGLYLWRVAVDVLIANLRMAALILTPSRQPRPAFVELSLALKDPFACYLLATTISLSPGSLPAAFSADRRLLLLHLLDTPDENAAAAECARIKDRYEGLLLEIFP